MGRGQIWDTLIQAQLAGRTEGSSGNIEAGWWEEVLDMNNPCREQALVHPSINQKSIIPKSETLDEKLNKFKLQFIAI